MRRIKRRKICEGIYAREKVEYVEIERFVNVLARLIEKYAEKIEFDEKTQEKKNKNKEAKK